MTEKQREFGRENIVPGLAIQSVSSEEARLIRGGEPISATIGAGIAIGLTLYLANRYLDKAFEAAEKHDGRIWNAVEKGAKRGAAA